MSSDKKKGDFETSKHEMGGDKKARANRNTRSRTGHKQNSGTGGRS